MEHETLFEGIVLARSVDALAVRAEDPLQVLSSAVLGGGRRSARTILSLRVPRSYDCRSPERDLRAFARKARLAAPLVGLMTAAPMESARVLAAEQDGVAVRAVVTVGIDNASRAGEPTALPGPGTINAIFVWAARLHETAAIELVAIASEAKASALAEAGVRTASGALATGTSTDAIVIAWIARGRPRVRYAGAATPAGALVGRLMREALAGVVG